jgi:hypothetical protein
MQQDYYVYGIFINKKCVYIGKGRGNRKDHHLRNFLLHNSAVNKVLKDTLANAIKNNYNIDTVILHKTMSCEQALLVETSLIKQHGKKIDRTGTLCNITSGGNQPPDAQILKHLLGENKFKEMKQKQAASMRENTNKKIALHLPYIKQQLENGAMLKDIAAHLNLTSTTVRKWLRLAGVSMNYEGKQKKIKQHLEEHRIKNKQKPNKVAKLYTIKEPSGKIVYVNLLKQYCAEHSIDYSNLRMTFKRGGSCKGYSIISQQEPTSP